VPLLDALIRTPLSVQPWGWWIAFAAVAVATAIDWNTRRIPNALTLTVALVALVANTILGGGIGLGASAIGLAFGLAFFLVLMALGAMGAGDVKLMAALGALTGVVNVFWIGLFTAAMGGLLVVFYSLGHRSLPRLFNRTGTLLKTMFLTGRLPKAEELSARREDYMPYALAIALGVVAQYLYRGGS
jgi:prepilin peptidase CpaA